MNNDKPDLQVMLAGKAPVNLDTLNYPVMMSPKLDGIRAIIENGWVVSRNGLKIPCPTVQELFGDSYLNGLDGELIVGDPCASTAYNDTLSFVMSGAHLIGEAKKALVFHVFDDMSAPELPYEQRYRHLQKRIHKSAKNIKVVEHQIAQCHQAVRFFEEDYVTAGYEGAMIRSLSAQYKFGRSTTREGGMLKLKRFEDAEAVIIGFEELDHNHNEERTGGSAKRRSSKKSGKVGGDTLGALIVRGINGRFKGVEFNIGFGFTAAERKWFWESREFLVGKGRETIVNYRYFPHGVKDKPRHAGYKGLRDKRDL